jgi:hypothetical protein
MVGWGDSREGGTMIFTTDAKKLLKTVYKYLDAEETRLMKRLDSKTLIMSEKYSLQGSLMTVRKIREGI